MKKYVVMGVAGLVAIALVNRFAPPSVKSFIYGS